MTMNIDDTTLLRLGPEVPSNSDDRTCWIALNKFASQEQTSEGPMLGRACRSLAEVEVRVNKVREDLDNILVGARARFAQR